MVMETVTPVTTEMAIIRRTARARARIDASYGNATNAEEHNSQNHAFGNTTFGCPQYDNEYTFNGESYNPNIHSQYLRARYYDMMKGSFLTEDSYLGDIRNSLTLNGYSYCIGNLLFYAEPSGHDIDPIILYGLAGNKEVHEAYDQWVSEGDKWAAEVFQGRHDRVNEAMDNVYDWLGESSGLYNRAVADQALSGFIAGFSGSFYATYDTVTHPQYILATVYYTGTHLPEVAKGIVKGAISGNPGLIYNIKNGNYRGVGQDLGYGVRNATQAALAAAVVKKCGELSNKRKGKITNQSAIIEDGSKTVITPEMEEKILFGQRKNPAKNELIGGHSPQINNTNPNYVVEVLQINTDGTQKVKFVTQYADGNLSNIKTSTLFQIVGMVIK